MTRRELLGGAALLAFLPARQPALGAGPSASHFRVIENIWIPMSDGTRLAARIFLPLQPVPRPTGAVLEYLPYRKRDRYRFYDDIAGETLTRQGFALIRVDVRGTGESGGWINDEYMEAERHDAVDVIAWIARQPWCNGKVGMRGISYGGFTALQAAALRPPALKAIIAVCATEDRFAEDVHAQGGALMTDNFLWGSLWKTILISPPDPEIAGKGWREGWLERLRHQQPLVAQWTRHRRLDGQWKAGSLSDYTAIRCGVYVAGGTVDAYTNAIPRLLARLSCPRKGLITPSGHHWPGSADPGPGIDWASEEARWWDYWLHGKQNGIMAGPMLTSWMQTAPAGAVYPKDVPGRWVVEEHWPARTITAHNLMLGDGTLERGRVASGVLSYRARQTVGIGYPYSCPTHTPYELPREQSPDDKLSLVFDSAPLDTPVEMLGQVMLKLRVAADAPVAKVVARLTEVLPDGQSWLISHGALNLTHRDSHEQPTALVPGKFYDVEIPFHFASHAFQPGSRIRLALSEGFFPYFWPSPSVVTLSVATGQSQLILPERPREAKPAELPVATIRNANDGKAAARAEGLKTGPKIITGARGGPVMRLAANYPFSGQSYPELGLRIESATPLEIKVSDDDPLSATFSMSSVERFIHGERILQAESSTNVRATKSDFHVTETLKASENGKTLFEQRWETSVARDLV